MHGTRGTKPAFGTAISRSEVVTLSFSQDTKNELILSSKSAARKPLLEGLIYSMREKNGRLTLSSENEQVLMLLKKSFPDAILAERMIVLDAPEGFGIADGGDEEAGLFLRGVFLAVGTVAHPDKEYHLEIVPPTPEKCDELHRVINERGIEIRLSRRKSQPFLYIKESEGISDFLTYIGAGRHAMELMNAKILKELRNSVNRRVNCEAANIGKTARAAGVQLRDIELIFERKGRGFLSPELTQVALIRLENVDMSLKEIGEACEPRISRSGVNHRLRKIAEIADMLRDSEPNE